MKEILISSAMAGRKLDRLLESCLENAGRNFIYRMLRRKNITLNGKKAGGHEILREGDVVRIWFSDETLEKFSGKDVSVRNAPLAWPRTRLDILYEDEHVLIVNKPVGMLSQKAGREDVSLNEYAIGYLLGNGSLDEASLGQVKPSVCNRLDRNTGGIVCVGKTMRGLTALNAMFRERAVGKYYHTLVRGRIEDGMVLEGKLRRDEARNISVVEEADGSGKEIGTVIRPLGTWEDDFGYTVSLLETKLITGRTHQIRAQLSARGYPLVGDPKYGDRKLNQCYREKYGVNSQLLYCVRLDFPTAREYPGIAELDGIAGRSITCREDAVFRSVIKSLQDSHPVRT